MVDSRGLSTCATFVKGIFVHFLDLIDDSQNLKGMTSNIGNVFIQAEKNEKTHRKSSSEFGDRAGSISIIVRVLYNLTTSAERFCIKFADYLYTLGFVRCCFDRDVYMHLRDEKDEYNFICTQVDDFKILVKDPGIWVDRIAGIFSCQRTWSTCVLSRE